MKVSYTNPFQPDDHIEWCGGSLFKCFCGGVEVDHMSYRSEALPTHQEAYKFALSIFTNNGE